MDAIFDWPGKTDDDGNEYPAVCHMLDVAACSERLIDRHAAFSHLSRVQHEAMVLLVALHDVGKFSESFRALIRNGETGAPLHWELSYFLLWSTLDPMLSDLGASQETRRELYAAVAGHHGRPPTPAMGDRIEKRKRRRAIGEGQDAARAFTEGLCRLFPEASLEGLTPDDAKRLSWALSGLTVVSDWIGSNTFWFPLDSGSQTLDDAMVSARRCAATAVERAGLVHPDSLSPDSAAPLGLTVLRPMQKAVSEVTLEDGPQLVIIEDSTGTGKTEAALVMAHRMLAAGKARGLFFALPTMATSDAMFERVKEHSPSLFEGAPSVLLTHSRAALGRKMRALSSRSLDSTPEADGCEWLTDGRRRSMLATVGVGTVDQALLGILPSRFSTLRLYGLADKVLILDEAHSYDRYMQVELEALLRMQARLGGSAILMTATLPLGMRQAYVSAFQKGLNSAEKPITAASYPGLHLVGNVVDSHVVEPACESVRTVPVRRLHGTDCALKLLEQAVEIGAAAVWVRNAVDDAIRSVQELHQRGIDADLLHARFALTDRLRHEKTLMKRFGRDGVGRRGRILVATQVVEASLDLDFDIMISDLAPIGSLIQRAGRLWRHMDKRPKHERPVEEPILHVISPDPDAVDGDRWLLDVIGQGAWVYRLDDQWRTARAIFDEGEIASPGGLRTLIEAVHGDAQPELPLAIVEKSLDAEGRAQAEAGVARGNVVDGDDGYLLGTGGSVGSDAHFPTRLALPQVMMVLARRCDGVLVPWAHHEDTQVAWALSELSAAKGWFGHMLPCQSVPEIQEIKREWPAWRQEAFRLCVVEQDGTLGNGLLYDARLGLKIAGAPV